MTEGWTGFDYALAVWCVSGFVTFTIAGLLQMARIEKSMVEAIRKVSNKQESVFQAFAPGRIGVEIDSTASGIVAGIGFAMVASGMGVALARLYLESGEAGGFFGALFCLLAATWALFYLCRAVGADSGPSVMVFPASASSSHSAKQSGLAVALVPALLLASGSNASACMPDPAVEEDLVTAETIAFVAVVTSIETSTGPDRICMRATYDLREVLRGDLRGPVNVEQCYLATKEEIEEFSREPASEGNDVIGFKKGANVLVAVTSLPPNKGMNAIPQPQGQLRYLVPTCWGPWHVNLDMAPESLRSELIEGMRRMQNAPKDRPPGEHFNWRLEKVPEPEKKPKLPPVE